MIRPSRDPLSLLHQALQILDGPASLFLKEARPAPSCGCRM